MMDLRAIVGALESAGLLVTPPERSVELSSIADDSRRVQEGSLFCAVVGTVDDGHAHVGDALARGASAALVTHRVDVSMPQVVVKDSRRAASVAAREWYGRVADRLTLIGVTGTNGKTTTVAIACHLLNSERTAGRIGTLGAFDGHGERLPGYGSLTTPGPIEFHAVLAELENRGASTVVMEASSHGLDQGRLADAAFKAAVYTNVTHEHLDYHPDLDAYAAAKMKLSGLLRSDGIEVVNADDPVWNTLPPRPGIRRILCGRRSHADVRAGGERLGPSGSECLFQFAGVEQRVVLPLIGEFNVSNALAASATAWGLGAEPAAIAERLRDVPKVPGRMELLASGRFTVIRDYAHTPDGFERSIATVRAMTPGKLIVLFGAGGDRDRKKRPVMGRIAATLADLVVLTEDNPRTEDPERTIDDIEAGMGGVDHLRIRDRERGIRKAISLLESGDCLLLLGKGHETYQIIGTTKLPFHEPDIVRSAVEAQQ